MSRSLYASLSPLAVVALASTVLFGPPHIEVKRVTDAANAPTPGAVLVVEGSHHQDTNLPMVTGRAEGTRGGKRISKPLTLTPTASKEIFGVARQWEAGTPWVLVFTVVEPGHSKDFGRVEAMVRIDAKGAIVGIDHPRQRNERGATYGRAVTPAEIDAALGTLATR